MRCVINVRCASRINQLMQMRACTYACKGLRVCSGHVSLVTRVCALACLSVNEDEPNDCSSQPVRQAGSHLTKGCMMSGDRASLIYDCSPRECCPKVG